MKVPFIGIVAEDFDGIDDSELSLVAGTKCVVTLCEADGWWTIHTKNRNGIFPGSYVDEIEEIRLPCYAKVQKKIQNIPVGKVVTVTAITADSWIIKPNQNDPKTLKCTWDFLEITTEEPEKEPAVKKTVRVVQGSVIDCEPLAMEEDIEPIKELKMPKKSEPKRVTMSGIDTLKTNGPNKQTKVSEEKRSSTYKRPVSIFGNFSVTSTYDIVYDKDRGSIYQMPDPNRRMFFYLIVIFYYYLFISYFFYTAKFEQEGRFEFHATDDVPPPPPFIGGERKYQTEHPSWIDYEARERSAVFDI